MVVLGLGAVGMPLQAQLLVNDFKTHAITFDVDHPGVWGGGVNPSGSGFLPEPTYSAPLDSDAWAAAVGSSQVVSLPADNSAVSGAIGFNGTLPIGAASRGTSPVAGFSLSGLGIVKSGLPWGNALGIRPQGGTGSDFCTIWLKVQNMTGQAVRNWRIDYDVYCIDLGTTTPVTLSYSVDGGLNYSKNVEALGISTPGTNTVTNPTVSDWTAISISETLIEAPVPNRGSLILRFAIGTSSTGDMNRIALDNISVTAVPDKGDWK